MVKHTQTICQQQPKNYLSAFDHFVRPATLLKKESDTGVFLRILRNF